MAVAADVGPGIAPNSAWAGEEVDPTGSSRAGCWAYAGVVWEWELEGACGDGLNAAELPVIGVLLTSGVADEPAAGGDEKSSLASVPGVVVLLLPGFTPKAPGVSNVVPGVIVEPYVAPEGEGVYALLCAGVEGVATV